MILNIENMDEFNKELNKKLNDIDSPQSSKSDSSSDEISNKLSIKPCSGESQTRKKTSEAQRRASQRYYEKNRHDILSRNSNYYSINKERIIKYNIENRRNRYNNDPIFRQKMQQYHLNYYYNNKLLLQEQKEQLNILTAQ